MNGGAWIAEKYLNLFGRQLDKFTRARNGLWRCRCPYCGDSKRNKSKTRGYFFWHENVLIYKCHNCGLSTTFQSVLKDHDQFLFREMMLEMFGGSKKETAPIAKTDSEKIKRVLSGIMVGYNRVSGGCFADYLNSRLIPSELHSRFYEIPSMRELAHRIEQYKDKQFPDVPCIGIPFEVDDTLSYIQCRTLEDVKMRYMTFEVAGGTKLFGYNYIDPSSMVSVLEGPFDSVFVRNAVANAGASDHSNTSFLLDKGLDLRFVYDRDYETNSHVRAQMESRIKQGFKVVVYDKYFPFKDINDAIIDGWTTEMVNAYLDSRTFKGLKAKIELSRIAK